MMLWLLRREGLLVLLASRLRVAHSPLQLPSLPRGSCCRAGLGGLGIPAGKEAGPEGEQHAGSGDRSGARPGLEASGQGLAASGQGARHCEGHRGRLSGLGLQRRLASSVLTPSRFQSVNGPRIICWVPLPEGC